MRLNVGRTARSQPNTRPIMSAPPLAVSERQARDYKRVIPATRRGRCRGRRRSCCHRRSGGRHSQVLGDPGDRLSEPTSVRSPRSSRVSGANGIATPVLVSFLRIHPGETHRGHLGDGLTDKFFIRNHHLEELDRKSSNPCRSLTPIPRAIGTCARQNCHRVTLANHALGSH
jgi:hypothetical protein